MEDNIKKKMEEYIAYLLQKPQLTAHEYAILAARKDEIEHAKTTGFDNSWLLPLLPFIFSDWRRSNEQ